MAKELGVNIRVSVEEYNDKIDKNHIISQAPNAGSAIKAGDTITVVVSKGKNQVSAPSVVGLTLSDAENSIKEKGFVLGTINYEYSDSHDKDVVISQSPNGGSLKPGDKINVVVSRGPKPVEQKPVTPEPPKEPEQPADPNKPTDGNGNGGGSTPTPEDGSSGGQNPGGTTDGSGGAHPGSGGSESPESGSGIQPGGDTGVTNPQPNPSGHQQ